MNPNVLVARQAFLAIDHDDAFAFLLPILGAPLDPAEDPLLEVVDQHVLAQELGRKVPPLAGFRAAVAALTDEQIAAIGQATPAVWQAGLSDGKLATLLDVMRRRRDAIEKWLPQVEARIQR